MLPSPSRLSGDAARRRREALCETLRRSVEFAVNERAGALLEILKSVSEERQIVVCSQEREVLEWARERLVHPGSRVVELSTPIDSKQTVTTESC